MRKYQPAFDNEVDLDDPKTYDYLPKTTKELDALMFKEIGYAIHYMDYLPSRKGLFPKRKRKPNMVKHPFAKNKMIDCANVSYNQRKRVEALILNFSTNRQENNNNVLWYQEQVFLFQDETENMC